MEQYLVLRAIGKDRVGIVDDLSALILRSGCNIEESRMAVLGGEFAVIMLISGMPDQTEQLKNNIRAEQDKLEMKLELNPTEGPHSQSGDLPYVLETLSFDAPGIVHSVTSALKKLNINIEDMETDTSPAPWTGAPMFHMRIRLTVPGTLSPKFLREEMNFIANEEGLDIRIEPLKNQ